jgi:hypothetical protein
LADYWPTTCHPLNPGRDFPAIAVRVKKSAKGIQRAIDISFQTRYSTFMSGHLMDETQHPRAAHHKPQIVAISMMKPSDQVQPSAAFLSTNNEATMSSTFGQAMIGTSLDMSSRERSAFFGVIAAQELASKTATDAGWYTNPFTKQPIQRNFGEVIALMHSELSEALEAHRKGLMDKHLPHRTGVEVELADCVIRILDTAAALKLDLAGAIIEKNRYNQTRADHKLEARAAGGKKY